MEKKEKEEFLRNHAWEFQTACRAIYMGDDISVWSAIALRDGLTIEAMDIWEEALDYMSGGSFDDEFRDDIILGYGRK